MDITELCPFHCDCQEAVDKISALTARAEQAERQADADKTMYAEREERLWSELNTMNRQHVASAKQMADLGREIERLRAAVEQAERERDDAIERLQDCQSRAIELNGENRRQEAKIERLTNYLKQIPAPYKYEAAQEEIERLRAALTTIAERPSQYDESSMLGQLETELKRTAAAALAHEQTVTTDKPDGPKCKGTSPCPIPSICEKYGECLHGREW